MPGAIRGAWLPADLKLSYNLIAQVGDVRWTGDDGTNGTTLRQNADAAARILDDKPGALALFDAGGVPLIRATVDPGGQRATVSDRAGVAVRYVVHTGHGLEIQPVSGAVPKPTTVVGTEDLLLAAVLTATEALPEERGLSACHRLFPIEKAP